MPVCIAGMHRSGTSLVARVLRECGFYLGPDGDLIPPTAENPEGFWENVRFVRINDRLLARLGGSWSNPPSLAKKWELRPDLEDLRADARALAAVLGTHGNWAWKDPRNSLTLPFWRAVVPDLKVIICVRHPAEVVSSLQRRTASEPLFGRPLWLTYNPRVVAFAPLRKSVAALKRLIRGPTWASPDRGMSLWSAYYESVTDAVPERDRLVTRYDSFVDDAVEEIRRILGFLKVEVESGLLERAAAFVSADLHRERGQSSSELPPRVAAMYEWLCAEAGSVTPTSREPAPTSS